MNATTQKNPPVPLGQALGTFIKPVPLNPQELVYIIEARRVQLSALFDRMTLTGVRDLLLSGNKDGVSDSHKIKDDSPELTGRFGFYGGLALYDTQLLEIVRVNCHDKDWRDDEFQENVFGLRRNDAAWMIVGIKYWQMANGYKKSSVVRAWDTDTETVLKECQNVHSPYQVWHAMEGAFKRHCEQKRKLLAEFEKVEQAFAAEHAVYIAHAVRANGLE